MNWIRYEYVKLKMSKLLEQVYNSNLFKYLNNKNEINNKLETIISMNKNKKCLKIILKIKKNLSLSSVIRKIIF